MAGVKQFDRSEVLDRAMALFWTQGYEATSIDDLVEATGINRGSLYGTFGDKKRLFLAVLDRYWDTIATNMFAKLSDPDPRGAIERMLEALILRNSDPKFPRGCFITNTSLECPTSGDEIARRIAERMGQQETAVYRVLRRAQTEGSLRSDLDARALARFFLGVAQGINVVNKAVADPEVLKDMARVAMSVWGRNSAATVQSRPARAFIRVNCAAISPSLIASELFGHEQGAFTGALQRRIGRGRITFSTRQGKPGVDTVLQALRFTKQGFERPASPRRPDGYPDSQAPDAGRSGAPELLYSHVHLGRPLADKFPLNRFEPSVRAGENLGPDEEVMSGPESNRRRNQGLGEYG